MNRLKARGGEGAKRRRKKAAPRRASSTASSSSSTSGSSSPSHGHAHARPSLDAPTTTGRSSPGTGAASSSPTTPSAKECEQCGNAMLLDASAAAATAGKGHGRRGSSGCQVCDYVVFRKAQRPCEHCGRPHCEYFCDWCGHGFHAKCARQRHEDVTSAHGFCCRKCEAEQVETDSDREKEEGEEPEENPSSRCGECQRPFNTGAAPKDGSSSSEPEDTGFQVNQAVLVENDDVLYNAVITDVDAGQERIRIHFLRWSKSFDDWYAMDDERINESLACDCCNRWFHIGCLPPIKSAGRFKDTTYVCPTCLEDARAFYGGGTRTAAKKAAAALMVHRGAHGHARSRSSSSAGASSGSSDESAKKRTGKATPVSEDDDEEMVTTTAGSKKSEAGKKLKRKRSGSVESAGSAASDEAAEVAKMDDAAKAEAKKEVDEEDASKTRKRARSESGSIAEEKEKATPSPKRSPKRSLSANPSEKGAQAGSTTEKADEPMAEAASPKKQAAETEPRHSLARSMSSLLNSASPPLEAAPVPRTVPVPSQPLTWPTKPTKPISTQSRPTDVAIKPEGARPKRSYVRTKPTARRPRGRGAPNGLSAFDILREVAEQSMSNELRAEITTPSRAVAPPRTFPVTTTTPWRAPSLPFPSTMPPPLPMPSPSMPSPAASTTAASPRNGSMQSFVDVHFGIRREMYLRICQLEEERHLSADNAHRLRTLIYPTSDKFLDLKFVYVVNKDLPSAQLTRRLLELLPGTASSSAAAAASTATSGSTTRSSVPRLPVPMQLSMSMPMSMAMSMAMPSSTQASNTSNPTRGNTAPASCPPTATEPRPTTALVPLTFPPPNFTSSMSSTAPAPLVKLRNGCCISSTCN